MHLKKLSKRRVGGIYYIVTDLLEYGNLDLVYMGHMGSYTTSNDMC
jgi:hypothetical protein